MFQMLRPRLKKHVFPPQIPLTTRNNSSSPSIKHLQEAFRDPKSPYYISPGSQGPASPDEVGEEHSFEEKLEQARLKMVEAGFFWQQQVAWGDHDAFHHVNNVHYVRFFESSRIRWMTHLGNRLGGPQRADSLLKGKGISLILKSIQVNYRRPVTYPDTLLLSHKPYVPQPTPTTNPDDPSHLYLTSSAFSVAQQAFVAHAFETSVWYDYDKLRKCDPGREYRNAVWETFGGPPRG
ncbi:hypothetical protein E1B28_007930 [Marasmius oreades]|uniref:Thioesterase/thiol ester dehydrase-isomerase n=1 Tax=Marasmius oreades TaxID=181124 RepID=A0A9P7S2M9_9AGAR|nr:uncharacterized protein E1B28_007930 [Marasmius oreades]KAG7094331.1 hypothetical protein E1B28_007930 [Marasmius oreades]